MPSSSPPSLSSSSNTMIAVINWYQIWKKIIAGLDSLIDEAVVIFYKKLIIIRGVSLDCSMMVELRINANQLNSYQYCKNMPPITVPLADIKQATATYGAVITVKWTTKNPDIITLTCAPSAGSIISKKSAVIPLRTSCNGVQSQMPDLECGPRKLIPSSDFNEMCRTISSIQGTKSAGVGIIVACKHPKIICSVSKNGDINDTKVSVEWKYQCIEEEGDHEEEVLIARPELLKLQSINKFHDITEMYQIAYATPTFSNGHKSLKITCDIAEISKTVINVPVATIVFIVSTMNDINQQ